MQRNHLSTPPSKTSKISLKDLFYKDSPESDGLICAGPLIEYIPFNEPLSSLPLLMVQSTCHIQSNWFLLHS